MHESLFSSKSDRWFTPPDLLLRISGFLGPYFDPCPAVEVGTPTENGLAPVWRGAVFVNPPYGREIGSWVRKTLTEPVREAILLVPARPETRWFTPCFDHTICFVNGRLCFARPDKVSRPKGAPFPSALVYRGRRHRQFAEAFCDLGPVMRTYMPMRAKQPTLFLPGEMALEEAV